LVDPELEALEGHWRGRTEEFWTWFCWTLSPHFIPTGEEGGEGQPKDNIEPDESVSSTSNNRTLNVQVLTAARNAGRNNAYWLSRNFPSFPITVFDTALNPSMIKSKSDEPGTEQTTTKS